MEPLCIEKERINSGEENLVRDFPKDDEEISVVRNWINSAVNSVRRDLLESLNGCINEDYDKAYVENCIFEFERGDSYAKKRVKDND